MGTMVMRLLITHVSCYIVFWMITGFGPFGSHSVNASWVAVNELNRMGLGLSDVDLVTKEITVEYDTVRAVIPKLWQQYQPKVKLCSCAITAVP